MNVPQSIDATAALLASQDYVADRALATTVFLALRLQRPLFVEGEPGTGKTEIAKVLATGLGAELIRLQCYEGLDVNAAAYEWNYARQLVEIRLAEATHESREAIARNLFSEQFLIERPLLRALLPHPVPPVLLIDELDRTDEPFEAYLLEVLSDFQITVPELGVSIPLRMLRRVDFPLPEGPKNTTNSPVARLRLTPRSAWTSTSPIR